MTFSLIMATYGEGKEHLILRLLNSLNVQTFKDFELIVVDQNDGNQIQDLISADKWRFNIEYMKSQKGLSKARNVGKLRAKGKIICFPDDDCTYPPELLKSVFENLKNRKDISVLAIDTLDIDTLKKLPYTKKAKGEFLVSGTTIFKAITSISIFCKNNDKINFDENLGLGTDFPSCEESDFVTKYLRNNEKVFFTDKLYVLHPNHITLNHRDLIRKVRKHGKGHGAYFKKHLKFVYWSALYNMIVVPLGGMVLGILSLNKRKFDLYLSYFVSRIKGFNEF